MIERGLQILSSDGFGDLLKHIISYVRYNVKEKWEFVYLEWCLDGPEFSLPEIDKSLVVRIATRDDIPRIKRDIFPLLTSKEQNDKNSFHEIEKNGLKCFIAERDNKIVHYFLVHENARESGLMKTPFDKAKVLDRDAYLVSTFTSPNSRGLWIVPHTLLRIFEYLKNNTAVSRVLVLVHKDTLGAEAFYRRLGFSVIKEPYSIWRIASITKKLGKVCAKLNK